MTPKVPLTSTYSSIHVHTHMHTHVHLDVHRKRERALRISKSHQGLKRAVFLQKSNSSTLNFQRDILLCGDCIDIRVL